MLRERKEDLSIYYFIVDLFADIGDFLNVVDGFPLEGLEIPTLSVEARSIDTAKWELGNRTRVQFRTWYIDVFAKNKSQRDELAYRLLNGLEACIPVYDYDEGFPPDVSPTELGCLEVEDLKLEIIRVFPELVDKLYYRATVAFVATYNQLT